MQVDIVTAFLVFSILAILFVIGRLYYAIKSLHKRVSLLSKILLKLKKTTEKNEINEKVQDEINNKILEEGF